MPKRIKNDVLINDIKNIAQKLNHPPTRVEYKQLGKFAPNTISNRFNGWKNALLNAGFDIHRSGCFIPTKSLINDLIKVGSQLGRPPTNKEYSNLGKYHASTVIDRFGSFISALKTADFQVDEVQNYSPHFIIAQILELSHTLGRTPTRDEFDKMAILSRGPVIRIFGSWNQALKVAGLRATKELYIPKDKLYNELLRVAKITGRTPKQSDFRKGGIGKYSSGPFIRVFGSFYSALKFADLPTTTEKNVSKRKLIEELHRVAKVVGHSPSLKDFDKYGKYGTATYQRRFGSWNSALSFAGYEIHKGQGNAVIASDNNEYGSFGEAEIANILYEGKNKGMILDYLHQIQLTDARKWSCDFMLVKKNGNCLYIEYDGFGLKRPRYNYSVLTGKMKFYKNNSVPLIIISPHKYKPAYGTLMLQKEFENMIFGENPFAHTKKPHKIYKKTPALMLDELIRVSNEIGHSPSKYEFKNYSNYNSTTYVNFWGTWNKALKAAGLLPKKRRDIPKNELIENLCGLKYKIGRTPRSSDLKHSDFSLATYQRRFGSFNNALKKAGLHINKPSKLTRNDLINALLELHKNIGKIPRKKDMDEMGAYCGAVFTTFFGSWNKSLENAGIEQ